jgi:predicted ArsR family transcriptional regulator
VKFVEDDQPTRDRVCREILQRGPITARELGSTLGLTPAAVRRHLDGLSEQGAITTHDSPDAARRGRGRPARRYVLTSNGHAMMSTAYDDLAAQALEFLAETAGSAAVQHFADVRASRLASRYGPAVNAAGDDPHRRAQALAGALTTDGYAASLRSMAEDGAGSASAGKQLCQGHCPIQQVAARFPQLCEAETKAFSSLLGVHVQRLATLAHGEHVCTTHVPAGHVPPSTSVPAPEPTRSHSTTPPKERSADEHRVAS